MKIIKNMKKYKQKYEREIKKVDNKRLQTLLKQNQKHQKNCNINEQKIIQTEIDTIQKEITERKQPKQATLGE